MGLAFVRKKKGPIHCCIDFCNFEKAYPKDEFPLLNKGILVDTTIGHSIFNFMDGFSSYNQIRMDPSDAEKTAFWTLMAIFFKHACCSNAGATNRRIMTIIFHDMLYDCLEYYVDDVVVKSR